MDACSFKFSQLQDLRDRKNFNIDVYCIFSLMLTLQSAFLAIGLLPDNPYYVLHRDDRTYLEALNISS